MNVFQIDAKIEELKAEITLLQSNGGRLRIVAIMFLVIGNGCLLAAMKILRKETIFKAVLSVRRRPWEMRSDRVIDVLRWRIAFILTVLRDVSPFLLRCLIAFTVGILLGGLLK